MGSLPNQDPLQQLFNCVRNSLQHGRTAAEAFLGGAQLHLKTLLQTAHAASTASVTLSATSQTQLAGHKVPEFNCRPAVRAVPLAAATLSTHQMQGSGSTGSHSDSAARKAELGRATWTLLHMMAAQYPERPSRRQQRDAATFITTLARVYPCGSCGAHFQEILRRHPPAVRSKQELQQWTCFVHNVVNHSLGKPSFNCDVIGARWSPLECAGSDDEDGIAAGTDACDMVAGRARAGMRGRTGHM